MTTAYENPSEDPLTIGILIPRLGGGGAEFVALQWAAHLRDQGHQVVVITTHGGSETHEQLTVTALRAGSFLARVSELRRHVAAGGYDVLLSLMPHWNVLALLATTGLAPRPAVVISGRNIETTLRTTQSTMYKLELMMSRVLYPRADGYVAISHPVAAEAASRYRLPIERIWVVPNPATGKTQDLVPRRASELRTVTLTVPARLVRQKRPELAVETAAILRDRYGVPTSVEYFGHGPEERAVSELAERHGVQVDFRGWVTAWFSEVAADAVVLLPSTAEGFGNVLVEAAAAGVPSVTSSRALGTADAVVPGITGILAMGSEPSDYAAAVIEAMPLAPVQAAAWLRGFSPEVSGARLLVALRSAVARRHPGRRGVERAVLAEARH